MKKILIIFFITISHFSFCQSTQWITFNTSNSRLPNNSVYSIAIDKQGIKWVGTDGDGLVSFDGVKWTIYNTANSGLYCNYIRTIAIDAENNKWIGTQCGGLHKFDGANWTVYDNSNSILPSLWVSCIAIDRNGVKWVGCGDAGLVKIDGDIWTLFNTTNSPLPLNNIYSLAADTLGNIWIGTNGGGTVKYDGTNWIIYNKKNSGLRCNASLAIAIDKHNNKWIGSYTCGVFKFNDAVWVDYDKTNSALHDNWISTLAIDKQQNIWVGMDSTGIAKFTGSKWSAYDTANSGLANKYVRTIAIDGQGNKWIGTYLGGISVFNEDGVNIPPVIIVTSPSNGTNWIIGAKQTVRWSSSNIQGNINIKLSTDGGVTYPVALAANTSNDGSEDVIIPNIPSSSCRIKIESNSDPSMIAISPGYFRIVRLEAPTLALPANNSRDVPDKIKFFWNKSKYTDKYKLSISENSLFSKLFFSDSTLSDSSKEVSGLKHGVKYYWRVTGKSNAGTNAASEVWTFISKLYSPDNLKATLMENKKVVLSWKDNSNNELGFIVERKSGIAFEIIDTVLANRTLFTDSKIYQLGKYEYRVRAYTTDALSDYSNTVSVAVTAVEQHKDLADDFTLYQNYPNPFNPNTTISYFLPEISNVEIVIYDIRGEVIKSFMINSQMTGYHDVTWDGMDFNNQQISSGTYIYMIKAAASNGKLFVRFSKMMLLK